MLGRQLDGVRVFRNVPYAQARRFEPPAIARAWTGTRDGQSPGPVCPQSPSRLEIVMGASPLSAMQSEDCLHLSISTPDRAFLLPVMVWIHGGAYLTGGGELPWYDAQKLAVEGNVVVVSVTYRLGVFGYLWSAEEGARNLGLKDQIAALHWVKANIDRFGGDPERVTVFGQSAGGHSIAAMLSQGERNRPFKRAIIQSAPLGTWQNKRDAENFAGAFHEALGQDHHSATTKELLLAQRRALSLSTSAMPIGPVLTPDYSGRAGLDVLVGWTKQDASPFVALALKPPESSVRYKLQAIVATWRLSQSKFSGPSKEFARMTSGKAKMYVYSLDWQPSDSRYGACHCLDLPLLLGDKAAWQHAPMLGTTPWDVVERLGQRVRSAWSTFARSGDPTTEDGWQWKQYGGRSGGSVTRIDA